MTEKIITVVRKVPEYSLGVKLIISSIILIFGLFLSFILTLVFKGFNDSLDFFSTFTIICFIYNVICLTYWLPEYSKEVKEQVKIIEDDNGNKRRMGKK